MRSSARVAGLHGRIRYPTLSRHVTSVERGNERARRGSARDSRRRLAYRGRADARRRRRAGRSPRARRWKSGATICARASIICGARRVRAARPRCDRRRAAHAAGRTTARSPASSSSTTGTYLGMCGHGLIGVVRTLEHLGRLERGVAQFDTPVGTVSAELDAGRRGDDSRTSPSRCHALDVAVDVPGIGPRRRGRRVRRQLVLHHARRRRAVELAHVAS